jgi:hypothetical protein
MPVSQQRQTRHISQHKVLSTVPDTQLRQTHFEFQPLFGCSNSGEMQPKCQDEKRICFSNVNRTFKQYNSFSQTRLWRPNKDIIIISSGIENIALLD